MLSRRAICLWLLGVSVCLGLAVSAVAFGQLPTDTTADQPSAETPAAAADDPPAATEATRRPSRSRRATTGAGRSEGSYGQSQSDPSAAPQSRYDYYPYTNAMRPYAAGRNLYDYYTYMKVKPRKADPEMEKLLKEDATMEAHAQVLAKRHREAKDQGEQAKVRSDLETLTKEHFDLRQERRELEISRLEAQLQRVRDSIKRRNAAKDLIVQRRITQLLHEEDDLAF